MKLTENLLRPHGSSQVLGSRSYIPVSTLGSDGHPRGCSVGMESERSVFQTNSSEIVLVMALSYSSVSFWFL